MLSSIKKLSSKRKQSIKLRKIAKNETKTKKKRDENETITTTISHATISMITRSNATASKFIKLFNNIEFNDENVDFFSQ